MKAAVIAIIALLLVALVHSHSHSHLNQERVDDGAYSPRDSRHYDSDEHHSEFDHEAILGSTKEAEEFDHLPPEVAKERLSVLLLKMDLNGDTNIDRKELKAWILRSLRSLSEEESQEKLEEVDADRDGFVTWVEYLAETYGIHDESDRHLLSPNDVEEEKLIKNDKELFNAADLDHDGKLDKAEFLAFSHPEEAPHMLSYILKHTLEEKDVNKDGYIDFQEFIGERGKDKDKAWIISEKEKFDHDVDKNGDGWLDKQEIIDWVIPSNEEIAEEEVDHLFASSDDDHDDFLSFHEILDHHDIFVGSEATDFGDHLHNIHHFQDEL